MVGSSCVARGLAPTQEDIAISFWNSSGEDKVEARSSGDLGVRRRKVSDFSCATTTLSVYVGIVRNGVDRGVSSGG